MLGNYLCVIVVQVIIATESKLDPDFCGFMSFNKIVLPTKNC